MRTLILRHSRHKHATTALDGATQAALINPSWRTCAVGRATDALTFKALRDLLTRVRR